MKAILTPCETYAEENGIYNYKENKTGTAITWYRCTTEYGGHKLIYKHTYDGMTEKVTEMHRMSADAREYMNR